MEVQPDFRELLALFNDHRVDPKSELQVISKVVRSQAERQIEGTIEKTKAGPKIT